MKRLPDWITVPLLAFALSRLLIFGAGMIGDTMLPTEEGHWVADESSPFLSMWAKWDSQYYVDIAANGYWFRPGQQSNVAFFPLYPMTMQVLAKALGGNLILAGFIVSNLAFFGGLVFLHRLTELELDLDSAKRAVYYLAFFPASFFFSAVYTESMFIFVSVAAMYFARRHRWGWAVVFGILTAATRNLGILIWALVLWEWLRAQGWEFQAMHKMQTWLNLWNGFKQHWFQIIIISLIPLGTLAYVYFLKVNFDRPLAFIETQSAWQQEKNTPVSVITNGVKKLMTDEINKGWMTLMWNIVTRIGFLALVPFIWFRLGEGYAIYVLILLLAPTNTGTGSLMRYMLAAFPAFILLGGWGRDDRVDRALNFSFAALLGVFVVVFVNWVFVA